MLNSYPFTSMDGKDLEKSRVWDIFVLAVMGWWQRLRGGRRRRRKKRNKKGEKKPQEVGKNLGEKREKRRKGWANGEARKSRIGGNPEVGRLCAFPRIKNV